MRNNCHYMAAGIAYWALFSLFPLALAGIAILGFIYPTSGDQATLVQGILQVVPISSDYLTDLVAEVAGARGTLGILAIAGLLWTGTAVFSAVRRGINHAWHIGRPPYFVVERAQDLAMLIVVALWAFSLVAFSTNVLGLADLARQAGGRLGGVVSQGLLELGGLAATYGAILLMYRYLPNTTVSWRDVWLGALLGTGLFYGVKVVFGWLVGAAGSLNLVYGSLGALMAMLLWAYLAALALVFGAQVTYVYRQVFGSQAGTLPELQPTAQGPGESQSLLRTVASWLVPPKSRKP